MKRIYLLFFLLAVAVICVDAKKNNNQSYDYELEMSSSFPSATAGYVVFKVWSFGKEKHLLTKDVCMRNAIHGVLFKGIVAPDTGAQGNVDALIPGGNETDKKFFDEFFNSGEYMKYIQATNRGGIQAGDVMKISNKIYKVGMLVQVNLSALRKRMEDAGIIKSARSIFSK